MKLIKFVLSNHFVQFLPLSYMVIVLILESVVKCSEMISIQNKNYANIALPKQGSNKFRTRSRIECGAECNVFSDCNSFSFNERIRECVHYSDDFVEELMQQTEDGLLYYYVFRDCQIDGKFCPVSQGYTWNREACFCYKFYNDTRNYSNAVLDCKGDFGHLARIDRRLRQKLVGDILDAINLKPNDQVRIQGYLKGSQWYYADDSPLRFYNWNIDGGQPDGQTGLAVSKEFKYLWHDVSDDIELPFLCEVDPNLPI